MVAAADQGPNSAPGHTTREALDIKERTRNNQKRKENRIEFLVSALLKHEKNCKTSKNEHDLYDFCKIILPGDH